MTVADTVEHLSERVTEAENLVAQAMIQQVFDGNVEQAQEEVTIIKHLASDPTAVFSGRVIARHDATQAEIFDLGIAVVEVDDTAGYRSSVTMEVRVTLDVDETWMDKRDVLSALKGVGATITEKTSPHPSNTN